MNFGNLFNNISSYLKDSFLELKKVRWLSREQTTELTIEVIIFSLIFVVIYGIFDAIFIKLLFMFR
jgi:preprotein translocase SecE subunit